MSQHRVGGFRECARNARDLLQPMMNGSAGASTAEVENALEQAWGRLLTVDKNLELSEAEIRTHLNGAHDSLEAAARLLQSVSNEAWPATWRNRLAQARSLVFASGGSPRSVPPSRRSSTSMRAVRASGHVAGAPSQGMQSAGSPRRESAPPPRRESAPPQRNESALSTRSESALSHREDRASVQRSPRFPTQRKESSPSLELGEMDLSALGELSPELAALLNPGAPPRKESSPSLELGELSAASLTELGPELRALLQAEGADLDEDRSDWSVLEVEVGLVGDNNFFAGLSMDVSEGGVFIATYEPRAVGTRLMLSFVLPDGHMVTTPGVVRFLMDARGDMPPGMGVAFVDLNGRDLKAIRGFCKARRPTYYETD